MTFSAAAMTFPAAAMTFFAAAMKFLLPKGMDPAPPRSQGILVFMTTIQPGTAGGAAAREPKHIRNVRPRL